MSEPTRAVVIEGVPLVRAGISSVLREHHVAVVAEASSAAEASALVRGSDAHLLVVGDDGTGTELAAAIGRVKERNRDVRVVALVPPCTRDVMLAILDAGADAVVPSEVDRDELLAAVEAVRLGRRHVAPAVTAALFADIRASEGRPAPESILTSREHAIVRLAAEGGTNEEIGDSLFISAATVKTHLSNAYVKLGARNRYDAVVKATQLGLL
ncbi:MAG TPA: response regulator transcription factor [Acidimicrobiales bacterium]|nr:response regulator transcription factor [Acidimicrobiales bacterium]